MGVRLVAIVQEDKAKNLKRDKSHFFLHRFEWPTVFISLDSCILFDLQRKMDVVLVQHRPLMMPNTDFWTNFISIPWIRLFRYTRISIEPYISRILRFAHPKINNTISLRRRVRVSYLHISIASMHAMQFYSIHSLGHCFRTTII